MAGNTDFLRDFFSKIGVQEETDEHRMRTIFEGESAKDGEVSLNILYGGSLDVDTRTKPLELTACLRQVKKHAAWELEREMVIKQNAFPIAEQDLVFWFENKDVRGGDFYTYREQHIDISHWEARRVDLDEFKIHDLGQFPKISLPTAAKKLKQMQDLFLAVLPVKWVTRLSAQRVNQILTLWEAIFGKFKPQ